MKIISSFIPLPEHLPECLPFVYLFRTMSRDHKLLTFIIFTSYGGFTGETVHRYVHITVLEVLPWCHLKLCDNSPGFYYRFRIRTCIRVSFYHLVPGTTVWWGLSHVDWRDLNVFVHGKQPSWGTSVCGS